MFDKTRIGCSCKNRVEVNCFEQNKNTKDTDKEPEITYPVDHKCLDRRSTCRRPLVPETDEQI